MLPNEIAAARVSAVSFAGGGHIYGMLIAPEAGGGGGELLVAAGKHSITATIMLASKAPADGEHQQRDDGEGESHAADTHSTVRRANGAVDRNGAVFPKFNNSLGLTLVWVVVPLPNRSGSIRSSDLWDCQRFWMRCRNTHVGTVAFISAWVTSASPCRSGFSRLGVSGARPLSALGGIAEVGRLSRSRLRITRPPSGATRDLPARILPFELQSDRRCNRVASLSCGTVRSLEIAGASAYARPPSSVSCSRKTG